MSAKPDLQAFLEFEKERWSLVPAAYHRFFEPVTAQLAGPLLAAAGVHAGFGVLDVATGPGYVARAAAALGAHPVGVDISEQALAIARELNPGIPFVAGDAHRLPFASESFDAVVANFLMPHLADHVQALKELVRVAVNGCKVAVSNWDVPEHTPLVGLVQQAVSRSGASVPADIPIGPEFFKFSQDSGLIGLLRAAGLERVAVTSVRFEHRLSSPQELWDGIVQGTVRTSVLVTRQPPEIAERIKQIFAELAERYVDGGQLVLPVSVKIAAGHKP